VPRLTSGGLTNLRGVSIVLSMHTAADYPDTPPLGWEDPADQPPTPRRKGRNPWLDDPTVTPAERAAFTRRWRQGKPTGYVPSTDAR
jgi:hypothetical protein